MDSFSKLLKHFHFYLLFALPIGLMSAFIIFNLNILELMPDILVDLSHRLYTNIFLLHSDISVLSLLILRLVINLLVLSYFTIVIVKYTNMLHNKRDISFRSLFVSSPKMILNVLLVYFILNFTSNLLYSLLIDAIFCFSIMVIPLLFAGAILGYFIIRLFLSVPVIVLENKNILEGFLQSWNLTKNRFLQTLRVFIFFIFVYLLFYVTLYQMLIYSTLSGNITILHYSAFTFILQILGGLILIITNTVYYLGILEFENYTSLAWDSS